MNHLFLNKQFLLFLVSGGIAAVVNFFSRYVFDVFLSFSLSIVLAYLCGMMTAYILNMHIVFKNSNVNIYKSILVFSLVNAVAVAQTWLISMLLAFYVFPGVGVAQYSYDIAHAIGIIVPVFTSYIGHKFFTYK